MSPSEHQLRAALHHGEGDGVDAGAVIARARAVRHARRVRVASAAAAVIAVGAVGTGGVLLAGHSGTDTRSIAGSNAKAGASNIQGTAPTPYTASGSRAGGDQPLAPSPCPATLPQLAAPGGGGTGQFGGSDQIIAQQPASVLVCGYGAQTQTAAGALTLRQSITLTDGLAREFATSLNAASTKPRALQCAHLPARALAVYAASAGGALPVVTVRLDCLGTATNGTAVRYGWQPPADLAATIDALTR